MSFLVLTGLMAVSWRGRKRGVGLIIAAMATAAWAGVFAYQSARGTVPVVLIYLTEALHDTAWLAALVGISGATASRFLKAVALSICAVACLTAPVSLILEALGVMYFDPTLLLSRSQLALSLAGLILIEQIYRNSSHSGRETIKYFAIAVGAMFAYDLFLYSQAELLRGLTFETWNARGLLVSFAVPLIALSSQRTPDWSLDVFVSRQVVFYSTTFLVVGAYLLVMALGGYYVKEFGGAWGNVGQIVFFAGAAVALASLLASGTLRRHATVFLSKHFYRNKYDYRLEWLRFIQTLSSTEETDVRRTAVRAIAQIFSSPGGILFLRDEDRRDFVPASAWPMGLDSFPGLPQVSAQEDLAKFVARTKWIIDLKELRETPDTYGNINVPEWLLAASELRIIAPLIELEAVVGFICLYEPPPPFELTYEDRDLLKTVGRHVATHIAQDDANRKLSESRQFEAYNRLTAFMMHDLKNSVAQLKLIVENSARHRHNPDFIDDAIATIANAADRMSRLIEQLRGANEAERIQAVDLSVLAREAAKRCEGRSPFPSVVTVDGLTVQANPERLTAVIEHIIRNAQDATKDSGSIEVVLSTAAQEITLSVKDSGSGMDPEFLRERLFRPFDSTKGSKGMGIGAYQVREYVRQLGGRVEVQSTPGQGTVFSVILPSAVSSISSPALAAVE